MSSNAGPSHRFVLPLGAAILLTAAAPVADLVANAASPLEALAALREAASAGQLGLVVQDANGALKPYRQQMAADDSGTFDRTVTFDKVIPDDRRPG